MNVSVYLLDAALSGDDLALKQLNDILEEYKLNKIPEIKLNWKQGYEISELITNFRYTIIFSDTTSKWLVYLDMSSITNFNSKEEAKEFVEQRIKNQIYGRP
jgi:hypothetical protein